MLGELNDAANRAIAQMNLGIVYSLLGNPVKALEVYAKAESTFRTIGDELNLAKVLTCKGLDRLVLQDWKQAEEEFAFGADLFQRLGDLSEYLNALDGLGISYLEQGCYDQATAIFESILVDLPEIAGTRAYPGLTKVIRGQIDRARAEKRETLS